MVIPHLLVRGKVRDSFKVLIKWKAVCLLPYPSHHVARCSTSWLSDWKLLTNTANLNQKIFWKLPGWESTAPNERRQTGQFNVRECGTNVFFLWVLTPGTLGLSWLMGHCMANQASGNCHVTYTSGNLVNHLITGFPVFEPVSIWLGCCVRSPICCVHRVQYSKNPPIITHTKQSSHVFIRKLCKPQGLGRAAGDYKNQFHQIS